MLDRFCSFLDEMDPLGLRATCVEENRINTGSDAQQERAERERVGIAEVVDLRGHAKQGGEAGDVGGLVECLDGRVNHLASTERSGDRA